MRTQIAVTPCLFLCAAGLFASANDPQAEKAIMETMDAMRKATIARDIAVLDKVYHPDLTYTHSSGRTQGKADVLASVENGPQTWEAISFSRATFRIYGSTAIFEAICDIRSGPRGKIESHHSDILWVLLKGPERWRIVARHSVSVPMK